MRSAPSAVLCAALIALALSAAEETPQNPDTSLNAGADAPVEVVDLTAIKKSVAAPKIAAATEAAPDSVDVGLDDELIKTRAAKSAQTAKSKAPKPLQVTNPPETPANAARTIEKPTEPGFASVLTGTLSGDREIGSAALPHLIRGVLVVPSKTTLKIGVGATIHLRGDPSAKKPSEAGIPDPTRSAVIWVYGTLIVMGESGLPVEFVGLDKDCNASILLYGSERSRIDGARLRGVDVAQTGGVCQWVNCEFNETKYCALAGGAALYTHCSFKKCGGIFAAYDDGPWALLARKCLFESCRDGLMFARDPGQACLVVEKNNFIGTRGANLRMMPRPGAVANPKAPEELLIGENWYGTRFDEEIEHRIVDNRSDRAIKAHLNTRPPAQRPYHNIGAGVGTDVAMAALEEQQAAAAKMMAALAAKQKVGKK